MLSLENIGGILLNGLFPFSYLSWMDSIRLHDLVDGLESLQCLYSSVPALALNSGL